MKSGTSVMRFLSQPLRILSSRAFLIWMIGGWIFYYVLSAIWIREAFAAFVAGLRGNLFLQIPFLLFLLSGYLNLLQSLRSAFTKGIVYFLVWLMLSAGFLFFFTGFLMSAAMRESGQRIIGEGDVIDPPWTRDRYRVVNIDPGLKDRLTDIDAVSGIFAYEPKVNVVDQSSQSYVIGAFPPVRLNGTYYHILNFGIAPGVLVFEKGALRDRRYMILRIITPGSSDYFDIPDYPYRFLVELEAEGTVRVGKREVSRYNLKNPLFSVRVFQGDRIMAEGNSHEGITIGDLTLKFVRPTFWVMIEAVRDQGVQVMHAGMILLTFGIPISVMRVAFRFLRR